MMLNNSILVLAGGGAITMAVLLIIAFSGGKDDQMEQRMLRVSGKLQEARKIKKEKTAQQSMRRIVTYSTIPAFDRLIKMLMPNPDKLRMRLAKTGRDITLGAFLLVNILLISVVFFVIHLLVGWAKAPSLFLGIAVGLIIPHMVIGIMGSRRIKQFLASFPEAIDTMCRGLRSGLPVSESISAVGREMADPVGIEFRRISDGVRMGRSLEDSMWDVTQRIDVQEFRFLIISMAIQKETGGNLAETLGNLSDLIRKRRQLRLKIRAMSSEARASALIIGSLPFVMFSILWMVNSDYVMTLFLTLRGNVLLGFGLGLIAMGAGVMRKMINFEI
jgi:tight adherence protein B